MPGFDGTGPWGAGPMTGWGRGFCNPSAPGAYGLGYRGWYGRGLGYGRGWFGRARGYGRGWGWRAYGAGPYGPYYGMSPSEEAEMLKAEAEDMKRALEEISKRIEELERQQDAES